MFLNMQPAHQPRHALYAEPPQNMRPDAACAGRRRYYYTTCGVREAEELNVALHKQSRRVDRAISRVVMATEALKACGFPSGEASRLHQYAQKLMVEWQV